MKTYLVDLKEIHNVKVQVEADFEEEAKLKVQKDDMKTRHGIA